MDVKYKHFISEAVINEEDYLIMTDAAKSYYYRIEESDNTLGSYFKDVLSRNVTD